MSTWMWAPSSRAARSSGRNRPAASSRPRSGASGRSSGVSAETLTDTLARGSGPRPSRSSTGRAGQPVAAGRSFGARRRTARRTRRPRRRSASPRRAGRRSSPPPTATARDSTPSAARGLSPTMKRWAMWRTPPAAAAPSAARPARGVRDLGSPRRSAAGHSGTSSRNRPGGGEVIERAARRHDVDEPEQRRAQLAVAAGELHRPGVDRAERVAAGPGNAPAS